MKTGPSCFTHRAARLAGASPAALLLPALLLALAAAGCGPSADKGLETPADTAPPAAAAGDGDSEESSAELYTVRGEIVELRVHGDSRGFMIHHEAIDGFKGITGEVWGMDAMTMPFEIAADVPLDEVADGDKVEFTLRVDWSADSPQVVTAIEKLPADVELEFRAARPPAPEGAVPPPESGEE